MQWCVAQVCDYWGQRLTILEKSQAKYDLPLIYAALSFLENSVYLANTQKYFALVCKLEWDSGFGSLQKQIFEQGSQRVEGVHTHCVITWDRCARCRTLRPCPLSTKDLHSPSVIQTTSSAVANFWNPLFGTTSLNSKVHWVQQPCLPFFHSSLDIWQIISIRAVWDKYLKKWMKEWMNERDCMDSETYLSI